jgi:hypothetical protein
MTVLLMGNSYRKFNLGISGHLRLLIWGRLKTEDTVECASFAWFSFVKVYIWFRDISMFYFGLIRKSVISGSSSSSKVFHLAAIKEF